MGILCLVGAMAACGTHRPARTPGPDPVELMSRAAREYLAGCYVCLRSAASLYESALDAGAPVETAAGAAARARILMAARERDSGLKPTDALERAGSLIDRVETAGRAPVDVLFLRAAARVAAGLPHRAEAVSKERMAAAANFYRTAIRGADPAVDPGLSDVATVRVRAAADHDVVAEYLSRAISCAYGDARGQSEPRPPDPPDPGTPALSFVHSLCGTRFAPDTQRTEWGALLAAEPRFHEARYFLGWSALGQRKLVSAERDLLAAANGLPESIAAWSMLGAARVLLEEYADAAGDYRRALSLEPDQREAMLGLSRALTFSGDFEGALIPGLRLIEMGTWFQADANYWVALDEYLLGRIEAAEAHVRQAKRLNPMHGDTARLVGLIAQRRGELDLAQSEFELAVSRNARDCEALEHLGQVHGLRERWALSVENFLKARNCDVAQEEMLTSKEQEIRASDLSESRKEAAVARIGAKRAGLRAAKAQAIFGAAEGEHQRGAHERALQYLDEAATEPLLATRVADLRRRIASRQ